MSIVQTMTQSNFQDALKDEGFSYSGTEALYNYYEELSEDLGEPFEFDAVAIRCDWTEYGSLEDVYKEYAIDYKEEDTTSEDMLEYFNDNTTLIELDNGHVLVEAF